MSTTPRARSRRILQALTAIPLAASALAACGTEAPNDKSPGAAAMVERDKDGLNGTLVDPPLRLANVTLRDTRGNPVRLNKLPPSKVTALFFGFTHCEDVCPTTMADLASARRALSSARANRIRVVFVTVDPGRDSPFVLRTWLDQFDTQTVGLRGPTALVHQAEGSLYADQSTKAPAEPSAKAQADGHRHEHPPRSSATSETDHQVNHSGSVYVFGPNGETVLYSGGTTVDQYAADFTRLLRGR